MKRILLLVVSSLLCAPLHCAGNSQGPARKTAAKPRFEDYSVKQSSTGKPSRIVWPSDLDSGDPQNRKFIDSLEEAVTHGPNFAGHYSIARWGLGTGVSSIAVVDLSTGRVFREMPFVFLDVPWDSEGKIPYRGYSFRADSRLLIASGCFYKDDSQDGSDCGWKYYEWEQDRLVLLRALRGPIPPNYHWQKQPQE